MIHIIASLIIGGGVIAAVLAISIALYIAFSESHVFEARMGNVGCAVVAVLFLILAYMIGSMILS